MNSAVGMPFTLKAAAAYLGGALHPECDDRQLIEYVAIDSREVEPGSLFVPLPGRYVNGHDYILAALERGASLCIVAENRAEQVFAQCTRDQQIRLVIVADPLSALQRLARWYIGRNERLVKIAVTGSNGKTTTKELIASILEQEYSVFKTPGNFNSVIGVPIASFAITDEHRYAVFELAMSERGEMRQLANIVFPDIAVLTNIGTAHIGNIGSQEGIAEEKKLIFSSFSGQQRAFLPENEPYYDYLADGIHGQVIPFGSHHTPGVRDVEDVGLDGSVIYWGNDAIRFPLPGTYNLQNVYAAISVAVELGASPQSITAGVQGVVPPFGRGQILRGQVTVVQDCYNANPESMAAAIAFVHSVNWEGRKILVLGDMLELGCEAFDQHRRIVELVTEARIKHVYYVGKHFSEVLDDDNVSSNTVFAGDTVQQIAEHIAGYVGTGDLVLLKGSRGIGLEVLAERIQHAPRIGGALC